MNILLKIWLSSIICFSLHVYKSFSQKPGEKFVNQNCEYIYFVNDTLIDFKLIGSFKGSVATMYHGIGKYTIKNDMLTVSIDDFKINSLKRISDSMCLDFKEKISGIDKYRIESLPNGIIELTGPILGNYQKLNRRKFLKSFLNWPWKWCLKKQHWYDPRVRQFMMQ